MKQLKNLSVLLSRLTNEEWLKKMIRNNCPLNQIQDPKKKISRFLQNITIFMKKSATHQTIEALTPFIHTLQQLLNPPIGNSITLELLYKMNEEQIGQLLQILHYFEYHKHNKIKHTLTITPNDNGDEYVYFEIFAERWPTINIKSSKKSQKAEHRGLLHSPTNDKDTSEVLQVEKHDEIKEPDNQFSSAISDSSDNSEKWQNDLDKK